MNKLATQYHLSGNELMQKMAWNFDIDKVDHDHIRAKLGKYDIENVDVELAPLLVRINKFTDEPITTRSSQYDHFGWAYINFSWQGFKIWKYILLNQYIKTFGPSTDDTDDGREFKGLYKRFFTEPFSLWVGKSIEKPNVKTSDVELEIRWSFSYDNIPIIIKEFDQLFGKTANKTEILSWVDQSSDVDLGISIL